MMCRCICAGGGFDRSYVKGNDRSSEYNGLMTDFFSDKNIFSIKNCYF